MITGANLELGRSIGWIRRHDREALTLLLTIASFHHPTAGTTTIKHWSTGLLRVLDMRRSELRRVLSTVYSYLDYCTLHLCSICSLTKATLALCYSNGHLRGEHDSSEHTLLGAH